MGKTKKSKNQIINKVSVSDTRAMLVWFTNNTAVEALPEFYSTGKTFIFELVDDYGNSAGSLYEAKIKHIKKFEPIS